jgi:hypothetical protein
MGRLPLHAGVWFFDYSPQQADDFRTASGPVDPRTDMYVVNINLDSVVGNNGPGPSFLFI